MNTLKLKKYISDLREQRSDAGFAYHFTDLSNIGNILRSKCLYSRAKVEKKGLIVAQGGDFELIHRAPEWVQEYVRCYLRPRPPMLYHVEGIKPKPSENVWHGRIKPHIPLPVYLIFDLVDIFETLSSSYLVVFDGNAASNHSSNSRDTNQKPFDFMVNHLDWDEIFQQVIYSGDFISNNRRQAEILIQNSLSMDLCSRIVFRSSAEYKLAREEFPEIDEYALDIERDYFNCRYAFVEDARINPNTKKLHVQVNNLSSDSRLLAKFRNRQTSQVFHARTFNQGSEHNEYFHRCDYLPRGNYTYSVSLLNEEYEKYTVYKGQFKIR
jgi:hypothetical protein